MDLTHDLGRPPAHADARWRPVPVLVRLVGAVLAYVGVVVGGLTLFLAFAPVFGYLAYSDRPGPGWLGGFPAVGWADFWAGAGEMAGAGAFMAVLFLIPAAILVGAVSLLEAVTKRAAVVRTAAAVLAAPLTGYWALSAAWYISGAPVLGVLGLLLGGLAGAFVLPAAASRRAVRAAVAAALALFAVIPVQIAWEMGPAHRVEVRLSAAAQQEQVDRVWYAAGEDAHFASGADASEPGGRRVLVFGLHPRTSREDRDAFRAQLERIPGVERVRELPREW